MDLIAFAFQKSSYLRALTCFQTLEYRGTISPKLQLYRGLREVDPIALFISQIIEKEESLSWKSCQELIAHGLKMAAQPLKGFYGFDLLAIELDRGLAYFDAAAFSTLIINHARKLQPSQSSFIQYGSLFGMLKMRIPADWGKIEFSSAVEIYSKESFQFDLHLKKIIREAASSQAEGQRLWVVHDLSAQPIFKFGDEAQTERLRKTLMKLKAESGGLPEIEIIHRGQRVNLAAQFQL